MVYLVIYVIGAAIVGVMCALIAVGRVSEGEDVMLSEVVTSVFFTLASWLTVVYMLVSGVVGEDAVAFRAKGR